MKTVVARNGKPKAKGQTCKLVPIPDEADIVACLSKVKEVDAIFTSEYGECHVYSVIRELDPAITRKVYRAEERLSALYPDVAFDFHVWIHQGRNPAESGPHYARLIFHR